MESEFSARGGWAQELGLTEAKVLHAALQAGLEDSEGRLEALGVGEEEALDALVEHLLGEGEVAPWADRMKTADRAALGTYLLWLQYPESEYPGLDAAGWERLEDMANALGAKLTESPTAEMAVA